MSILVNGKKETVSKSAYPTGKWAIGQHPVRVPETIGLILKATEKWPRRT